MNKLKENSLGVGLCTVIALGAWFLGQSVPLVGAPVFAIVLGMVFGVVHTNRLLTKKGITFTSKKILQYAVILLGVGLNITQVLQVGVTSLPVILSTITVALCCALVAHKWLRVPFNIATLIGVGSSICGGSAIAATAPIIEANDDDVTQSISVIFLFNVLAALIFPTLASGLGLSHDGFALFAGSAVNDTSSVTATATAWDAMHHSNTLHSATIVKLTRTLAIIPITLGLSIYRSRSTDKQHTKATFPRFIIYFVLASVLTTIASSVGVPVIYFAPLKIVSKFFIVMAMAAIGLNTNIVQLIKNGGKSIVLGGICWGMITIVCLVMQWCLHLW